jgi:iron complex transport system substrate-binding protein
MINNSRFKIQDSKLHVSAFSLWLVAFSLFVSCESKKTKSSYRQGDSLKYAVGFSISRQGNSKLVEVKYPYQNATSGYKYLLVPRGETPPVHDDQTKVITIPIETIVCTSTTHIPLLDYLGLTNKLVGFPTTDYISSSKMRARIDSGKIVDLGIDKGMNIERLITLQPSAVMGYTMSNDLGQLKKIQELGLPVIINAEYLEKHPLGRAEWIKFMALFFNKEKEADSVFNVIEKEYLYTKHLAEQTKTKPTVMSGIVYGDTWYLPGGKNYASTLLADAGCDYLWKEDESNGFLELSFESVYKKANAADLWIGVGGFISLEEMKASEQRYAKFNAFKEGAIYTYNARKGAKGGSEFLELGYLGPDLILKDLVKIAHPEVLESHQLYFYKRLE